MVKKVKVIQTSPDELKNVIAPLVSDAVKESLEREKDLDKQSQRVQKILKRDSIAKEINDKPKSHDDSCPNCHTPVNKLDDTMSVCPNCDATTIQKGAEYLICEDCGGFVPISFIGTNKPCPHCGGTKARKP